MTDEMLIILKKCLLQDMHVYKYLECRENDSFTSIAVLHGSGRALKSCLGAICLFKSSHWGRVLAKSCNPFFFFFFYQELHC